RTKEICEQYTKKNSKIKYFRNDANVGGRNFKIVADLSHGKYFMWAGDHDLWDSTLISKSVSILEEDPNVMLVHSNTQRIDEFDNNKFVDSEKFDTRGMNLFSRYIIIISSLNNCSMFYGVFRKDCFQHMDYFQKVIGSDHLFLAEISLIGEIAHIDEPLFFRRDQRGVESIEQWQKRTIFNLDPQVCKKNYRKFLKKEYTNLCNEHIILLKKFKIKWYERIILQVNTIYIFNKRFKIKILNSLYHIFL
ncbi:MAG: glycosyltransferase, partial [Methanoregula sp.]|nr:glycosyltransferase [Methanoregula sp.]